MSNFARDFQRLINDTHHSRRNAFNDGFVKGAMLGGALGYLIETYQEIPLPYVLTIIMAIIGGVLKGYYEREGVILKHLTNNPTRFDARLLPLLTKGTKPNFTPNEEDEIVRVAIGATPYEKRLFQSLSPTLFVKIEELQEITQEH